MELVKYDAMRHAIMVAHSVDEVKDIRDKAEALRVYAKQSQMGIEDINRVTEIKLRAERRAGELLRELPTRQGERTDLTSPHRGERLGIQTKGAVIRQSGISKGTADRWQQIADIPEDRFEEQIRTVKEAADELTTNLILRNAKSVPHVSNNSGNNEWYTPPEYIEAARAVMGSIDLDPASSELANTVVGADRIYTIENSGLDQPWFGNVWMNPPYSSDLIGKFVDKLHDEYLNGAFDQAIVLVNNATETAWFRKLVEISTAVCFPASRVKFWQPSGDTGAPLQAQTILCVSADSADVFIDEFSLFGWCAAKLTGQAE